VFITGTAPVSCTNKAFTRIYRKQYNINISFSAVSKMQPFARTLAEYDKPTKYVRKTEQNLGRKGNLS